MDTLHKDQLRWAQMIKNASSNQGVIELTELAEDEPLSFDSADLLGCSIDSDPIPNLNPNGFGECTVCHKHRRLWSGVCGWCGADPEDFEEQ